MDVQFFWLEKERFVRSMDLIPGRLSPNDLSSGPKTFKLFDCETEDLIRSGHIVTISSDDPELHPLLSMALLEMQWILHRVLAMSGAAEAPDHAEYESDDDVGTRYLEEAEESDPESDSLPAIETQGSCPRHSN